MLLSIKLFFLFIFSSFCIAEEPCLRNIQQITFSEMGFERAGEAYFSPDESAIIFQAIPTGQTAYQIYHMNLSERIPKQVSPGTGSCTCAFFHPEGKKILFASSHSDPIVMREKESHQGYKWDLTPYMNIYEANCDGSELKALTSGPAYHAECSYSSDGSKIVYASNESGSMNIYIMNADRTDSMALTETIDIYNGGPFFSPDDTQIVFRADRDKPDYLQIYVSDIQSKDQRQLTYNDAINWAPYWHPDGDKIAFTTSLHGHHQYEIYFLHIPSGAMHRITQFPTFDGLPVFNQDGKKLMWTSKRSEDHTCQIFIADFINPFES